VGIRRLLDKVDEYGERSHQAQLAELTPAERERYELWERRGEAARNAVPASQFGDPRLTGTLLQGPAGEVVHGVVKPAKQRARHLGRSGLAARPDLVHGADTAVVR
jgi:hypothetical protein